MTTKTAKCTDPMEIIIEEALLNSGLKYEVNKENLDFYLSDIGIFIEVKQFHSDRISDQMSRSDNVIVAQGRKAVELLADMIVKAKTADNAIPSQEKIAKCRHGCAWYMGYVPRQRLQRKCWPSHTDQPQLSAMRDWIVRIVLLAFPKGPPREDNEMSIAVVRALSGVDQPEQMQQELEGRPELTGQEHGRQTDVVSESKSPSGCDGPFNDQPTTMRSASSWMQEFVNGPTHENTDSYINYLSDMFERIQQDALQSQNPKAIRDKALEDAAKEALWEGSGSIACAIRAMKGKP